MYRPYHLVGLELTISVLKAGLRTETTDSALGFVGDVVPTAKRNLKAGNILDGEGGYCVYGTLMPAKDALQAGTLPIGLAHNVKLKNNIVPGQLICWPDVEYNGKDPIVRFRREMERIC